MNRNPRRQLAFFRGFLERLDQTVLGAYAGCTRSCRVTRTERSKPCNDDSPVNTSQCFGFNNSFKVVRTVFVHPQDYIVIHVSEPDIPSVQIYAFVDEDLPQETDFQDPDHPRNR